MIKAQHFLQGDATRIPLSSKSVDLIIGSPPYINARLYLENDRNLSISRDCREWVDWMLDVTAEAVRVSRGLVLWVVAGVTRDHCYWPACEGLLWRWWEQGGQCWRPCFWHRVGIPGSGGKKWLRADVEYVLCFKGAGNEFFTDNTAMGHTPKHAPGGAMSYRSVDGTRKNAFGVRTDVPIGTRSHKEKDPAKEGYRARKHTKRDANGDMQDQSYNPPVLANPGNYQTWDFEATETAWHENPVIHCKVGGGLLGSEMAHANEAPFPEKLVEFFIRSCAPLGGTVLDPFSGSGTTVSVAGQLGRTGIGIDLRRSQCELGTRRITRPHAKPAPSRPGDDAGPGPLWAGVDAGEDTD